MEPSSFLARCQQAKKEPFVDPQPMTETPPCAWKNFCPPLLRQFDPEAKIEWKERVGYGLDGIFWDNTSPEGNRYWAVQRECHNAALLQILQASMKSNTPIFLNPTPKTKKQALINLQAFSDEGRRQRKLEKLPNRVSPTVPQIRECFGWTKVTGQKLWGLGPKNTPPSTTLDGIRREIWPDEEYYAIVYDFVPESQSLDNDVVQSQLDFYYLVGFCLTVPMRKDNWKGCGMLVDMADLICPWHVGWSVGMFRRRLANELQA
ncbi:hypothetical protein LZ31DRAFT_483984 [Colletotrichum somersetense]|nr:hypothetical protein LZ31DRAFT_483984 [Colletotrichum somersetense]